MDNTNLNGGLNMIYVLIGFLAIGFLDWACCAAAGRADDNADRQGRR